MTDDSILPKALTLDEAYRAAFFMTDLYVGLESDPDRGLVLFRQYLQSDRHAGRIGSMQYVRPFDRAPSPTR